MHAAKTPVPAKFHSVENLKSHFAESHCVYEYRYLMYSLLARRSVEGVDGAFILRQPPHEGRGRKDSCCVPPEDTYDKKNKGVFSVLCCDLE